MNWKVVLTKKTAKQLQKLPVYVRSTLLFLVKDLEAHGPATSGLWKNYCKFQGISNADKRHCHIIKGRPTYVCCWEVTNNKLKIIEVYYVGTHEKAPY